ncbi:MAG: hypothetical protein KJO17_02520, partial [Acidimicrobiia bacterium]|nr:hypothetical protein [Acidimicrobiia bacterium]
MKRDLVYTLRLRRRLLGLAVAGVLGVVGLAWLLSAAFPPHTASIVLELEEDVSTGAEWFPPNAPRNAAPPEGPFRRAVWPVASPYYDEVIANRLGALFHGSTFTAESIRERIEVDADVTEHRIAIEFRDDRRDV